MLAVTSSCSMYTYNKKQAVIINDPNETQTYIEPKPNKVY